jgi:hypothetical protein
VLGCISTETDCAVGICIEVWIGNLRKARLLPPSLVTHASTNHIEYSLAEGRDLKCINVSCIEQILFSRCVGIVMKSTPLSYPAICLRGSVWLPLDRVP